MAESGKINSSVSILCENICKIRISHEEFSTLKRKMQGFVSWNVQSASTPFELLWMFLEEKRCLEENTFIFIQLQYLFKQIKRSELVQIVSDYCEDIGKVPYIKLNKGDSPFVTIVCRQNRKPEQCMEMVEWISTFLFVEKHALIIKGKDDRLFYHDGYQAMREIQDIHASSVERSVPVELLAHQSEKIEIRERQIKELERKIDEKNEIIRSQETKIKKLQQENSDIKQKNKLFLSIGRERSYPSDTCQL